MEGALRIYLKQEEEEELGMLALHDQRTERNDDETLAPVGNER